MAQQKFSAAEPAFLHGGKIFGALGRVLLHEVVQVLCGCPCPIHADVGGVTFCGQAGALVFAGVETRVVIRGDTFSDGLESENEL